MIYVLAGPFAPPPHIFEPNRPGAWFLKNLGSEKAGS